MYRLLHETDFGAPFTCPTIPTGPALGRWAIARERWALKSERFEQATERVSVRATARASPLTTVRA